jgi:hypothetical protein
MLARSHRVPKYLQDQIHILTGSGRYAEVPRQTQAAVPRLSEVPRQRLGISGLMGSRLGRNHQNVVITKSVEVDFVKSGAVTRSGTRKRRPGSLQVGVRTRGRRSGPAVRLFTQSGNQCSQMKFRKMSERVFRDRRSTDTPFRSHLRLDAFFVQNSEK